MPQHTRAPPQTATAHPPSPCQPAQDAFCAGPCGHLCCVHCATKYVRSALGDVGNHVGGGGLRCVFHSWPGGDGACAGILEPAALKTLVGRPADAAAVAAAAAAFSTRARLRAEAVVRSN